MLFINIDVDHHSRIHNYPIQCLRSEPTRPTKSFRDLPHTCRLRSWFEKVGCDIRWHMTHYFLHEISSISRSIIIYNIPISHLFWRLMWTWHIIWPLFLVSEMTRFFETCTWPWLCQLHQNSDEWNRSSGVTHNTIFRPLLIGVKSDIRRLWVRVPPESIPFLFFSFLYTESKLKDSYLNAQLWCPVIAESGKNFHLPIPFVSVAQLIASPTKNLNI